MISGTHRLRQAACWLWLVAGTTLTASASPPTAVRDPLERPSVSSSRASASLLTAVTRAGNRLVAVGERGIVLTSDDDGKTWIQRPCPVSVMLTNVRFASPQRGWAVGHGGVVLRTTDGGLTWTRQLDGGQLARIVLQGAEVRAAAASAGASQAASDAAKALASARLLVEDGPDKPLLDVYVDDQVGVLVAGAFGIVLRSGDEGVTWESWQDRIPNQNGSHFYAILRATDGLYLVGEQGGVYRSLDQGRSFVAIAAPYKGSFFGAAMLGDDGVVVFGLRGHAYAHRTGGDQWQALKLPTGATINSGMRLQDGSTLLATQVGELLHTADGGRTFTPLKSPTPVPFVGVSQAADGTIVLAGVRGITLVSHKSSK